MKAVLVCTAAGRSGWAAQALASLDGIQWPVMVLDRYDYELGKLRWIVDHTDLTEVLLLHDSVVVKDTNWVDTVLDEDGSTPLCPGYWMYLGKYETALLRQVGIPTIGSKREACQQEFVWGRRYALTAAEAGTLRPPLFPDLQDNPARQDIQGRTNMVLANDQIAKFKGTWALSMITE